MHACAIPVYIRLLKVRQSGTKPTGIQYKELCECMILIHVCTFTIYDILQHVLPGYRTYVPSMSSPSSMYNCTQYLHVVPLLSGRRLQNNKLQLPAIQLQVIGGKCVYCPPIQVYGK
jgi:hypothetical protein